MEHGSPWLRYEVVHRPHVRVGQLLVLEVFPRQAGVVQRDFPTRREGGCQTDRDFLGVDPPPTWRGVHEFGEPGLEVSGDSVWYFDVVTVGNEGLEHVERRFLKVRQPGEEVDDVLLRGHLDSSSLSVCLAIMSMMASG